MLPHIIWSTEPTGWPNYCGYWQITPNNHDKKNAWSSVTKYFLVNNCIRTFSSSQISRVKLVSTLPWRENAGLNPIYFLSETVRTDCQTYINIKISSCSKLRKRAACAPSIWVWWNWNDTVRMVLNKLFLYRPQIINGLLKTPLYIPTAPSMSNWARAEVPITIQSVRSWFSHVLPTCLVSRR